MTATRHDDLGLILIPNMEEGQNKWRIVSSDSTCRGTQMLPPMNKGSIFFLKKERNKILAQTFATTVLPQGGAATLMRLPLGRF